MMKKNLTKKVLTGVFLLTFAAPCTLVAMPVSAEAAQNTLYDQYQQEQKLKELKEQVKKAQEELTKEKSSKKPAVQLDEKAQAVMETPIDEDASNSGGASSFVDRIQKILDTYEGPNNKFREFYNARRQSTTSNIELEKPTAQEAATQKENALLAPESAPKPKAVSETPASTVNLPPVPNPNSLAVEGRYNFDWRGTPLAQSIYSVAKIAGKGVVVNSEIKGNVYMSLNQITCDQALNYLASAFGLNWMNDGNNIIVSTADLMKQSRVFPIGYANKKNLTEELAAIGIDKGNIYANTETGTVSVTGTPYQLLEAEKRIKSLDHPVAQCLLLAQLIEINHGKNLNLGFSYTLPTYSHTGSTDNTTDTLHGNWLEKLTFSASSTATRELNKGKVIARPMVLSLNGQKGTVDFGDRVPVLTRTDTGSTNTLTVTYEDVGTKLEFTPEINETTGDITLTLTTEVSNITGWVTSGDTRAPQMSTRKATTSAHVKSGQSFVIGGLMNQKELDNLSGIPGLMNLPILGKLFSYHTHSRDYGEVYIMITPFILTEKVNAREIYDELKHLDKEAEKNDVNVPSRDWTKNIGQHKQEYKRTK